MSTHAIDHARRRVLLGAAALPVLLTAGATEGARASRTPVRRSIGALAPDDALVRLHRDAVGILRQRSAADPLAPTGWDNLALQHALYCSSISPQLQVHWGWDFLTWHRGHLWFLERILRDAVKEPQYALPYWDATTHRSIPAAFWGERNPLADATREQGPGDVLPDDFLDVLSALALDDFDAFGGYPYDNPSGDLIEGNLEQGFHNNVHNWVGGNMAMFATAGFETLFSAHHNNVDRAWERWRKAHPGGEPQDSRWLERGYTFVDERGRLERVKVKDLLDTERLGYTFPDHDFAARREPDPTLAGSEPALVLDVAGATGARGVRALTFQRGEVPLHPFCCRAFLRSKAEPGRSLYVGTFTILPVQRGGAKGLDRGVTMQLALRPAAAEWLADVEAVEAVIVGVPLKGRAIPTSPIPLGAARLVDAMV